MPGPSASFPLWRGENAPAYFMPAVMMAMA